MRSVAIFGPFVGSFSLGVMSFLCVEDVVIATFFRDLRDSFEVN